MSMEGTWKHHLRLQQATRAWERDAQAWRPPQPASRPFLDDFEAECDRQSVQTLVAAAETSILSACSQLAERGDDARNRELAKLYSDAAAEHAKGSRNGSWPDLGKVLTVLKKYGDPNQKKAVDGFRELHKFRHWLAHGRHWQQPPAVDLVTAWSSIGVFLGAFGFPLPARPVSWI